jgi:hypothetical protein
LKACKKLKRFSDTEFSLTPVRFTRILYAQLLRQPLDFVPTGLPKLPPATEREEVVPNVRARSTPTRKEMELGYKLLCGFEILYIESKRVKERRHKAMTERERSKAKQTNNPTKHDTECKDEIEEVGECPRDTAQLIDDILLEDDLWKIFSCNADVTPSNDDWLTISPSEVEDIISKKQAEFELYERRKASNKEKSKERKNCEGSGVLDPLQEMAEDVKTFVERLSEYSGVDTEAGKSGADDFDFDVKKFVEIMYGGKFVEEIDKKRENLHSQEDSDDEADEFYEMPSDDEVEEEEEELEEDPKIKKVMEMMDEELQTTSLGSSFQKKGNLSEVGQEAQSGEPTDSVDIDLNLVENFLKSFGAQHGRAGPVMTLLGQLKSKNK